jgi:hypothetical protein
MGRQGGDGNGDFGGSAADQQCDRVLQLRAADAGGDQLRLGGLELGLCGEDVRTGGDARRVLVLCYFQRAAVGADGVGQESLQGVRIAELEIVAGQLGLSR